MKKILFIEDDTVVRENTAELLELSDFEVITASNGKIGVALAKKEKPDIVVCDIMMPELDGYGLLKLVRDHNLAIPVLILTSDIQNTTRSECLALGALDVLNKPVKKETLVPIIKDALRSAKRP